MKQIRFIPDINYKTLGLASVVPAKSLIPQWYRNAELDVHGSGSGGGLKRCIPFLDIFLSGYYIVLPKSIFVKNNGKLVTFWSVDENLNPLRKLDPGFLVDERVDRMVQSTLPVPAGCQPNKMTWSLPVGWKTPRGWSTLVTHPINRFDLPFETIGGIVDSDRYGSGGNLPFYLKKDWQGILEAGTPIAQIIPFKRESWTHSINNREADDSFKIYNWMKKNNNQNHDRTPGFYRDVVWSKKEYF